MMRFFKRRNAAYQAFVENQGVPLVLPKKGENSSKVTITGGFLWTSDLAM